MSKSNPPISDLDSAQPPIIHQPQPFIPHPPITTEERVAVLTRILDPNDSLYLPAQSKNITALISFYKEGRITVNDEVFVVDGHIASREDCIAAKKPYFWEVSLI
ncbi:hypothetical protein N7449_002021 [Penicillium cf. viridicatum]|uniref:Uncharacterized protein n=1 Tax=Penicillium cf. viridicatum TaxID=2972119 RepID=A0A9W9MU97_9EURO|nr:hypothetical protein N7449_002021 [Penicillium cf. viridicatum]